ncbi:MAG TPA: outer membrane protein assembly factor BamD [Dongiaceae bacterium]|jgi:outer membrane protein assembly factor BamD
MIGDLLMRPARALVLLAGLSLLAACSSDEPEYVERPAEELYNIGYNYLQEGENNKAAQAFDEVERQHPYSDWATRAQLMSAYAHYLEYQYDDAIIALDRFIDLHPGHKDIAYAYYLRALCHYDQIVDVGRDQRNTELALQSLQEVADRFPGTPYARDATLKIDLARDHLAGKEMTIARFYQTRDQYLAAINRYRRVIEFYQTTSHTAEALLRLTECYLALGVYDEAQTAAAVLGYNYPGSDWYEDSYNLLQAHSLKPEQKKGSWLEDAF